MTADLKWNGEALIQYQEWPSFIQTMLICLILGDKHFHSFTVHYRLSFENSSSLANVSSSTFPCSSDNMVDT